jgi:hypothetical protein
MSSQNIVGRMRSSTREGEVTTSVTDISCQSGADTNGQMIEMVALSFEKALHVFTRVFTQKVKPAGTVVTAGFQLSDMLQLVGSVFKITQATREVPSAVLSS